MDSPFRESISLITELLEPSQEFSSLTKELLRTLLPVLPPQVLQDRATHTEYTQGRPDCHKRSSCQIRMQTCHMITGV